MVKFDRFLSILFPQKCIFCGSIVPAGDIHCEKCEKEIINPFVKQGNGFLSLCVFPMTIEGGGSRPVYDLKFRSKRENSKKLSRLIHKAFRQFLHDKKIELITFVPMSRSKLRKRGYNQAELLARSTAELSEIPCMELLEMTSDDRVHHHDLSLKERMDHITGKYTAVHNFNFAGKNILIVDDIVTTGLTLEECARILKNAGAGDVFGAAAAAANCRPLLKKIKEIERDRV